MPRGMAVTKQRTHVQYIPRHGAAPDTVRDYLHGVLADRVETVEGTATGNEAQLVLSAKM